MALGNFTSAALTECLIKSGDVSADSDEFDVLKASSYAVPVIVLYAIVIFVGAVGNLLVVLTIVRTKQLWTATNVFIANLAMSDVFVLVLDLPFSAYYQITDYWAFGKILCHIIPSAFAVVVYASTLTLTLIAIDRYILIVYPLKSRMTVTNALLLIVLVAVLSIGVATPIAVFSKYVIWDDNELNIHRRYCVEQWPYPHLKFIYGVCTLVLQYFVPLIIIGILYFCIFLRVQSRIGKRRRRQSKTIKMLVAVVTVFAICWTPWHLFTLTTEIDQELVKGRYYKFIDSLLRVFAMSSSCINPFLYGWFNDNYRTAFMSLVRKPTVTPSGIREETLEASKSVTISNRVNGYTGYTSSDEKRPLSDTRL